jgi:hypothetical protein
MLRHSALTWAIALATISGFTVTDPPTTGRRALLGWTPPREAGASNLRLAHTPEPLNAEWALVGKLVAGEQQGTADETIQIRPRPIEGSSALLGR